MYKNNCDVLSSPSDVTNDIQCMQMATVSELSPESERDKEW